MAADRLNLGWLLQNRQIFAVYGQLKAHFVYEVSMNLATNDSSLG